MEVDECGETVRDGQPESWTDGRILYSSKRQSTEQLCLPSNYASLKPGVHKQATRITIGNNANLPLSKTDETALEPLSAIMSPTPTHRILFKPIENSETGGCHIDIYLPAEPKGAPIGELGKDCFCSYYTDG